MGEWRGDRGGLGAHLSWTLSRRGGRVGATTLCLAAMHGMGTNERSDARRVGYTLARSGRERHCVDSTVARMAVMWCIGTAAWLQAARRDTA